MTRLIKSFATSAYRIMTGVKRLDKVRNSVVLDSVSRNDLIHTFLSRQLRFQGSTPTTLRSRTLQSCPVKNYGKTHRGQPRTNLHHLHTENKRTSTTRTHRVSTEPGRLYSVNLWSSVRADPQPPDYKKKKFAIFVYKSTLSFRQQKKTRTYSYRKQIARQLHKY